jgi:hypothetical protein
MDNYLIAQGETISDMWTFYFNGVAVYGSSSLDGVINYLRDYAPMPLPDSIPVMLRTLADQA